MSFRRAPRTVCSKPARKWSASPAINATTPSAAKTNDYLWEHYGLAAAGARSPARRSRTTTDWRFDGNGGPMPIIRTPASSLALPEGKIGSALVTPWEGAELIVPVGASSVKNVDSGQVNGGLKTNSQNQVIEQVKIVLKDLTTNETFGAEPFNDAVHTVYPWHSYQVVVKIVDIDDPNTVYVSRTATVSVVQPHINGVKFNYVNGGTPTNVNSIPLATTASGVSLQTRSVSDVVNTVSITFREVMAGTGLGGDQHAAWKLIPVDPTMATITGTNFSWNGTTATWTVADSGGLAAGQYFIHLPTEFNRESTTGTRVCFGRLE